MARYCPECGGEMQYDSKVRRYSCKSCGLSLSNQELIEIKDRSKPVEESSDEKKRKRHKDYLNWWFSERK
jgi:DNA-directed RNA polymerase subunit M/transcription elongation factor TFIIS